MKDVTSMLSEEHQLILKAIDVILKECKQLDEEQELEKSFFENARGYAYLLKDHIMKEDNILYPMAEEALNDEQKDAILKEYNEVEVNKFPKADINKFISIISELEKLNKSI